VTFSAPARIPNPMDTTAGERPALEAWDPEGDVLAPDHGADVLYVPPIVAAPPMLPRPEQRPRHLDYPPRGVKAFFGVGTADLNGSSLGFVAHAVEVDNYSIQWLWFPSARRWVPPNMFGVILAIIDGTEIGEWHVQPPTGHTAAAGPVGGASSPIVTVWYEAYIASSSGSQITV
jgi:hypothetical protein